MSRSSCWPPAISAHPPTHTDRCLLLGSCLGEEGRVGSGGRRDGLQELTVGIAGTVREMVMRDAGRRKCCWDVGNTLRPPVAECVDGRWGRRGSATVVV